MSTDNIDKLYKNYEILSDAKEKSEVSFLDILLLLAEIYTVTSAKHNPTVINCIDNMTQ